MPNGGKSTLSRRSGPASRQNEARPRTCGPAERPGDGDPDRPARASRAQPTRLPRQAARRAADARRTCLPYAIGSATTGPLAMDGARLFDLGWPTRRSNSSLPRRRWRIRPLRSSPHISDQASSNAAAQSWSAGPLTYPAKNRRAPRSSSFAGQGRDPHRPRPRRRAGLRRPCGRRDDLLLDQLSRLPDLLFAGWLPLDRERVDGPDGGPRRPGQPLVNEPVARSRDHERHARAGSLTWSGSRSRRRPMPR